MKEILFLFDVDGTLIDAGGSGTRAMTRAFHQIFKIKDPYNGDFFSGRTDSEIFKEDRKILTSIAIEKGEKITGKIFPDNQIYIVGDSPKDWTIYKNFLKEIG